jgi:hypothetical protein
VAWENVVTVAALLEASISGLVSRTEKTVKVGKGRLGPDDKATNVSSRSELKKVKGVDVASLNTRNVAEGADKTVVVLVHNKGTTALGVAAVSPLTLTSANLLGVSATVNIVVGTNAVQDGNSLLGLGDVLNISGNNKWELGGVVDLVTAGLNKGGDGRSGEGGGSGVTAFVLADTSVPVTPLLGGGEHATLTAHVTEGTLTTATVTGARNTWNTRDGTASTP